ncbi:hypothetical protein RB195_000850 [Necator americanus]|uniref:Endonuclease/exonuclease/phosphatase domain-containing protein n=1 Tax=Necator americanus TaxID=51031 RepID=A0ABR1DBM5_NECAM
MLERKRRRVVKAGVEPHLLIRRRPIRVVSCLKELLPGPTCGIQGCHESVLAQQKQGVYPLNPPASLNNHKKLLSLHWTSESPSGGYRNEIDHIIVNKRFCLADVAVVPKFYTGSDHRLLRGRFSFTNKEEKTAKFREKERERNPRTIINWDFFAMLAGFWEDSAMDDIHEEYDRFVENLHDSFVSFKTLELIRQRGAARRAGKQEPPSSQGFAERR